MQSDKTLSTQSYYFLSKQQMKTFHNDIMRLGNKSTKRGNNEAKFKNRSTFFKSNISKSLKNP